MLAEGGVCLVGNISHFKKDMKDKLQQSIFLPSLHLRYKYCSLMLSHPSSTVLETGQVTLSLPKRLGLEETQQLSWQLRCTLWACSDQQQRSRAFNRADVDIIRAHTMHVRGTQAARVSVCDSCHELPPPSLSTQETSAITKAFAE